MGGIVRNVRNGVRSVVFVVFVVFRNGLVMMDLFFNDPMIRSISWGAFRIWSSKSSNPSSDPPNNPDLDWR